MAFAMRARWIVIAVFFAFEAATACGAENWIGAGVCVVLVLVFLGVGMWDAGRESRYVLGDDAGRESK